MKVSTSTTASLVLAVLMAAAYPLPSRAQDESVRVDAVSAHAGASILRDVTSSNQEEEDRTLAKQGGNGNGNGGGGGKPGKKNDSTPQPTVAVTPAPSPTPPPVFQYPPVPYNSCGTRPPSTSTLAPSPAPTACVNPEVCNGGNTCCDGYSCKGKTCRSNNRQLRERKVAIEGGATEERKLSDCNIDERCNLYDNDVLCGDDTPSNRPPSNICNYGGGEYTASIVTCDGQHKCCYDGNGGYYFGTSCWVSWIGDTCCPKGYTRLRTGCAPLDCCDGDDVHQENYCPGKC